MKNLLILFSILLIAVGCRKDTEDVSSTSTSSGFEPTAVYVNGTVAGKILSEAGTAISGAPVHIGDQTTYTTDDGYFMFRNVHLNTRGAYIHVDHPGYWHASRRVVPKHNQTHYTTLTLMPREYNGQISSTEGGTIELADGASIVFEPNSFVTSSGDTYEGTVAIASRWMDPLQPETKLMMPGAFHGISAENKEVALKNYGITGVDLIASNGDPLQIADGVMATVHFPLHQEMVGDAPESIALWHFDEESGYWREEGAAVKDGDMYTGQVSHFSFWSVNESFETVLLEGTVFNADGEPLANNQVSVLYPAQNTAAMGYTDANGVFSGLVPAGESLILMVSDACNFTVYSQNIPPLSDDTDLGTIEVSADEISTTTLSGELTNCDGDAVNQAIIQICWPQGCQFIFPDADGSFEQTFSWCGATEFNIGVVDYTTGESFSTIEATNSAIDLGTVVVCDGPLETYMSLVWNGTERFYPFPGQYVQFDRVFLRAQDSPYNFRISIPEAATGEYTDADVSFNYFDYATDPNVPLFLVSGSCFIGECEDLSITITEYGEVGEFIEGTFSGVVDFTTSNDYFPNSPISGSFRVLRDI
ncbi:MAG: hypothetical protein ABR574_00980 [Cryomorphaceae bacterium]